MFASVDEANRAIAESFPGTVMYGDRLTYVYQEDSPRADMFRLHHFSMRTGAEGLL